VKRFNKKSNRMF